GRLDRRRTARRSGETGIETNHSACQDEKVGHLAAYPSGRNRPVRNGAAGCSDLKAMPPFYCGRRDSLAQGIGLPERRGELNDAKVGLKAEKSLKTMDIRAEYVRHPANGGATKFAQGL